MKAAYYQGMLPLLLAVATAIAVGLQSFIVFVVFVVRDDERPSALLFQSSVTTFAAYNNWGSKALYGFNSGNAPARKVSFNGPYAADPYAFVSTAPAIFFDAGSTTPCAFSRARGTT
jgi:hypothetical protein